MDDRPVSLTPAPGEGAELRKPHDMIVMVPTSGRITLTGRRLYNAIIHFTQVRMQALGSMPAADYLFEAPLHALLRTTGSNGDDRTAAKRYFKEMKNLSVDWESTAPGDGVKWHGINMLAEASIEVRNGENWARWSFPASFNAELYNPSRWARIKLEVLSKLSTYAAIALYEICTRYRDNPSGVTSRKPVAWWADALSQTPSGTERREWRKFKNERVKAAIQEISSETDLEVELIEHKRGRAIVEAQFAVRKKRVTQPRPDMPELVDAALVLRAEALGIRELKLEGLIREFGEARVRDKVAMLEKRTTTRHLRTIDNTYSYLRSLLRNDVEGVIDPTSIPGDPVVDHSAPAVVVANVLDAASEQLNARIADIRSEIQALDAGAREALVRDALHELSSRGMLNAVVSRRAAQGDVLHGLLGVHVVRLYGQRTYGPDWDKTLSSDVLEPQT